MEGGEGARTRASKGTRMKAPRPLAEMQERAEALLQELRVYCDRIEIAGSIRRGSPDVSDIEILAAPAMARQIHLDLFEDVAVESLLDQFVESQLRAGRWQHRLDKHGKKACGQKYKRLLVDDGVALDLFSVIAPAAWGVLFTIRTGPWQFSRRMVTPRAKGGCLPDDCQVKDGTVYRNGTPLEIEEEEDFFALCGLEWIAPSARPA